MKSVKLKSPVKTSVARHDEHPGHHALDPACAICQVDVGTKSPDGVREAWSITPCGHVFGSVCIKRYLAITEKPLCPVCRNDLFHVCSHPVVPASYDPKKSLQTRDEAAHRAFPDEPRHSECRFCRKQRLRLAKRQRMLDMLEGPPPPPSPGTADDGERDEDEERSGDSSADSEDEEGMRTPRTKGLRKIKALHPEDEDEGEVDDIVVADSPQLPATTTRDLPPVPGLYGYWDVARKGPDWKFLAWFDSQEPKTKTTAEQFS